MSIKANAAGLAIGVGVVLIGLAYVKRGAIVASAGQAISNVDGTVTDAALQIPGLSALTDPATGDFNPVAAGQAAGQATRDWFGAAWKSVSDWLSGSETVNGIDMGSGAAWSPGVPDPIISGPI
ncbi:hypothetical protein WS86_24470 [Burkholderia savannae]|uniref:hypothetical protein n=1 Tax=Burkholderia savannae TaxID=1637837 RepID=UPI0007549519|nr:hypothetical protein [Burkholderia savannae]AOJ83786.1 hypothetical protein WS86_24470 [Burkholderia savannae]